MLVFVESGRLGNQLFQVAGLKLLARNGERIILIGFKELDDFWVGDNQVSIIHSESTALKKSLSLIIRLFIRLPPKIRRLLSEEIVEEEEKPIGRLIGSTTGLRLLRYCKEAYFQSERLIDLQFLANIRVRPNILNASLSWFKSRGLNPVSCHFIHVRRGDYLQWPSREFPAVLPKSYFDESCKKLVQTGIANITLLYCSDDEYYLRDIYPSLPDQFIIDEPPSVSLVIMSLCGGGVLSASSFSWMATLINGNPLRRPKYIAPEYWAGFRRKRWYPVGSKTTRFMYQPVDERNC